ncbi:hypothetical protein ABPG72_007510 [Tetrahymena utriculariae]
MANRRYKDKDKTSNTNFLINWSNHFEFLKFVKYIITDRKISQQLFSYQNCYSTFFYIQHGNQEHNDYDYEEEDQTILDQASLQFRNILEQKKDKSEDNEDLFDVFQDNNNISNVNNNISFHSNNTSNIQLFPQNQANDKFIINKAFNSKKD